MAMAGRLDGEVPLRLAHISYVPYTLIESERSARSGDSPTLIRNRLVCFARCRGWGWGGDDGGLLGLWMGKVPVATKSLIVYDMMGMNGTRKRALSVFRMECRRVSKQHILYRHWKSQRH